MYLTQSSSPSLAPGSAAWGDPHVRFSRRGGANYGGSLGALPVVIAGAGLGVAAFTLGRTILTSGSFSSTASTANYIHPGTPLSQAFRRCSMEFSLKAHHPRYFIDAQTFWYRLSFEYNGNDLRNVAINALVDRSSTLHTSTFSSTWTGQAHSPGAAPVAEIMFQLTGNWDPVGRGNVSYSGELKVGADGSATLSVTSERNWVTVGQAPAPCARVAPWVPPPPVVPSYAPVGRTVFFQPGSDRMVEADERRLMAWFQTFGPVTKANIARGASTVRVEGFASTTQGGPANLALSRRRAERVAQLIRDALGSSTPVNVFARGEYQARTPDRVEAQAERRAVITINLLMTPSP